MKKNPLDYYLRCLVTKLLSTYMNKTNRYYYLTSPKPPNVNSYSTGRLCPVHFNVLHKDLLPVCARMRIFYHRTFQFDIT